MTKVGRFVTDPRAGAYCQLVLDSGQKILVNHDKGGFKTGRVTISETRLWGLMGGETLLTCDLDSAQGRAVLARLTRDAPAGSALATPLGAFVEHIKDCRSLDDVRALCAALRG
jgi:hypothetical protein